MDAALLKEREAFKRRAIATPSVENRRKKGAAAAADADESAKKKSRPSSASTSSSHSKDQKTGGSSRGTTSTDPLNYKAKLTGSSQYKFSILAKIIKHMKQRHLDGDQFPLTIDEILDETSQLDVGSKQRHWLVTEALVNNPKVVVTSDGKYIFKPAYNIRDRKALHRLLDKHDQRGLGGIYFEDVQESLPNAEKALKILGDSVIAVTRPSDKKKVLYYNDKGCQFEVDEEFQKLWRSVAVEGIDDAKIEEYLEKQGITSMQDQGMKKMAVQRRRKAVTKKPRAYKRHNDHMGDILKDYFDT